LAAFSVLYRLYQIAPLLERYINKIYVVLEY